MRTKIKLTGRKQLPRSSIFARATRAHGETSITLSIVNSKYFNLFPKNAAIKLRISENKLIETLNFGNLNTFSSKREVECKIQNQSAFSAPTCQLRVVQRTGERKGVLLGSTGTWTLPIEDEEDSSDEQPRKGILRVGISDIAPRAWALEIREDAHPVLYLDTSIPDALTWARTDPTFISSVFPAVAREIFDDILETGDCPGIDWMEDWLTWANILMPNQIPPFEESLERKKEWINNLLDQFCQQHKVLDILCKHLDQGVSNV